MKTKPLDPDRCVALVQSKRWLDKLAPGADGCVVWTGVPNENGYCRVGLDGSRPRVHRVAYVAATGADIPPGLTVDHLCHDPAVCKLGADCPHRRCVNPDHLEAVPNRENVLRGGTIAAAYKLRTHCSRGHELSGGNCLECNRVHSREKGAYIKAAHEHLGLTQKRYIAIYGQGRAAAEAVLNNKERGAK